MMVQIDTEIKINQKQYLHLREHLAKNARTLYKAKEYYIIPTDADAVNYLKNYLKVEKPAQPKAEEKTESKRTFSRKKKKD